MIYNRQVYLDKLISHKHNGMVKVITGIRRSGKSYLLFNLFYKHLLELGIEKSHIIKIALDDRKNKDLRNPDALYKFINKSVKDKKFYYVLLDEVQIVPEFEDVLNSCLHIDNVDVYVTGSNAKFLSKDIITEFRGRGDQIHIFPLSFAEFYQQCKDTKENAWQQYCIYGGLPKLADFKNQQEKAEYLKSIFYETYLKDIIERNNVRNDSELEEVLNFLASSVGSLTNPKKLADTFVSNKGVKVHSDTIKKYIDYFMDSFLVSKANRYDIKGKKYINTPSKYYFSDIGIRNAQLNFRQQEESHIMENIIYNELCIRGYNVDVGVVERNVSKDKKIIKKQFEIDFICNQMSKRYYIQSVLSMDDTEKQLQETAPLYYTKDSFKKIIIVKNGFFTGYNKDGILILDLFDFLLDLHSLDK